MVEFRSPWPQFTRCKWYAVFTRICPSSRNHNLKPLYSSHRCNLLCHCVFGMSPTNSLVHALWYRPRSCMGLRSRYPSLGWLQFNITKQGSFAPPLTPWHALTISASNQCIDFDFDIIILHFRLLSISAIRNNELYNRDELTTQVMLEVSSLE